MLQEKVKRLKKYKLLFVDDEETILSILSKIFKNLDAKFFIAKDGDEAIDILKNNSDIDFLITDINMPNVNGFELIRQTQEKYKNVKILILSAHSEIAYMKKANSLNVKNYLTKPLEITQLINAIVEE